MRAFVAGSTGAGGKILVPHLVEHRHEGVALVRTAQRAREVEALGATAAVVDPLDRDALAQWEEDSAQAPELRGSCSGGGRIA